jgi:hypothetical protein
VGRELTVAARAGLLRSAGLFGGGVRVRPIERWSWRLVAIAALTAVTLTSACSSSGKAGDKSGSSSGASAASSSASSDSSSSSSGSASSSSGASSGSSSSSKPLEITTDDPCTLVTQQQADALVGEATTIAPAGSANPTTATPEELTSIGINAPGTDVTQSICGFTAGEKGFGVTLYTLASGSTGPIPPATYYTDVSSHFGVPAAQDDGSVVAGPLGWTYAVIDSHHVVLTTAQKDPALCLKVMDAVIANLR